MDERLHRILRHHGLITSGALQKELGISRATLSRLMVGTPATQIIRVGQTRNIQYGLKAALPGIGDEIPLFRVQEGGILAPSGTLALLHRNYYVTFPDEQAFEGLPAELADMSPQGFLGRSFAHRYSQELGIPERPPDWSNSHVLTLEARRGEDLPGNLIIGEESVRRWTENREPLPARLEEYPKLAREAMMGQPAGSSAGGEQPKFTAFREGQHRIVKFADSADSPSSQRWRDLLRCEALALRTLDENGISSAQASIHEIEGTVFLEVRRFDRIGSTGRSPVLTLAAIEDSTYGNRDSWAQAAQRMERDKRITREESRTIRLLDAFGALISDTDRHFHNLAFFPSAEGSGSLYKDQKLKLAPAFDKLPMGFAPVSGMVVPRVPKSPLPIAPVMDVWQEAKGLASRFWEQVMANTEISGDFKAQAQSWLNGMIA